MKKEFKTESKKILNMMINSIYTNEEIFLRELISNASDAIDKLNFLSLTNSDIKINKKDLKINVKIDNENKTITISDNGIGMTKDELINNLGTIAKSGSEEFKHENEKANDIIGQFGVGFYSLFMVCKSVKVISKSINSDEVYNFESNALDGYEINKDNKETNGTDIILTLKDDLEDHKYSEYLDEYNIKRLIKKYSDYIIYPIYVNEDENPVNTMKPIWKKNKKEVTDEEYNNFYKEKFYDYQNPIHIIKTKVEGLTSYDALLFIPSHASNDYYTKEYEKGLELYSKGVLITNKCADLLPDYFSFTKGIVDTMDIDLNISRETMQNTNVVKNMAKSIETKIKKELLDLLKNKREDYEKFYNEFGNQIKYGIYSTYGMAKDTLEDLLMFKSSKDESLITLNEYVERNSNEDKKIYYASGTSIAKIKNNPSVESKISEGKEILYLTDYLDEFTIKAMNKYKDIEFIDVRDNKNEENKELNESNKNILTTIKEYLNIKDVRLNDKLGVHPINLVSDGEVSLEMEKVFKNMPNSNNIEANKILEINSNHPIYNKIKSLYEEKKLDELNNLSNVLYNMALLINGLDINDPNKLTEDLCNMISK